MRYFVNLDASPEAQPIIVDVTELPTGALDVTICDPKNGESSGRKVAVDVVPLGGSLSVRVDGRIVDLTTEGHPPELGAIASGHRSYVRVESERQRAAAAAKKGPAASNEKL